MAHIVSYSKELAPIEIKKMHTSKMNRYLNNAIFFKMT